jgi:hypothetical protein
MLMKLIVIMAIFGSVSAQANIKIRSIETFSNPAMEKIHRSWSKVENLLQDATWCTSSIKTAFMRRSESLTSVLNKNIKHNFTGQSTPQVYRMNYLGKLHRIDLKKSLDSLIDLGKRNRVATDEISIALEEFADVLAEASKDLKIKVYKGAQENSLEWERYLNLVDVKKGEVLHIGQGYCQ